MTTALFDREGQSNTGLKSPQLVQQRVLHDTGQTSPPLVRVDYKPAAYSASKSKLDAALVYQAYKHRLQQTEFETCFQMQPGTSEQKHAVAVINFRIQCDMLYMRAPSNSVHMWLRSLVKVVY